MCKSLLMHTLVKTIERRMNFGGQDIFYHVNIGLSHFWEGLFQIGSFFCLFNSIGQGIYTKFYRNKFFFRNYFLIIKDM